MAARQSLPASSQAGSATDVLEHWDLLIQAPREALSCLWPGVFYFWPSFQSSVHEVTSGGSSSSALLHSKNTVRKSALSQWGRASPQPALGTAGPFAGSYNGWIAWLSHTWPFRGYLEAGDVATLPRTWVKLLGSLCYFFCVCRTFICWAKHRRTCAGCRYTAGPWPLVTVELPVLLWWAGRLDSWLPRVLQPPWLQEAIRNQSWSLVTVLLWFYGVYKIYLLTGTFVQRQLWL